MKAWDNSSYLLALLISNFVAVVLLYSTWKSPRLGRLLFLLVFSWAGLTNWVTFLKHPTAYLEYADLAFFSTYRNFINGWFSHHLLISVGFIASCQVLIGLGMMAKGFLFRLACVGAMIFLLAVLPLGVGSGFPCTLLMAIAMYLLYQQSPENYLWQKERKLSMI